MRILRVVALVCPPLVFACSSASSTGITALDGGSDKTNDAGASDAEVDGEESPAPKDAGTKESSTIDAAKEAAAPPPKDVAGSDECAAYCAKVESCDSTCVPSTDCKVPAGKCAAEVRDYLECQATSGQWYCGSGGFSVVHSCKYDATLCD